MTPTAYLNGKLYNPITKKLETTNLLVQNNICIGIGYIPDDEDANQIDLKGNIITLDQCSFIQDIADTQLQKAGFFRNFSDQINNSTPQYGHIMPQTLSQLSDTIYQSPLPYHVHVSPEFSQAESLKLKTKLPDTVFFSFPLTYLLNPTPELIQHCIQHQFTFLPTTPKELEFFTPLLFTQLWGECSTSEFFSLFQSNLSNFYKTPIPSPSLNRKINLNILDIQNPLNIPHLNYSGIGHPFTK